MDIESNRIAVGADRELGDLTFVRHSGDGWFGLGKRQGEDEEAEFHFFYWRIVGSS